jgi:hypothetical protein
LGGGVARIRDALLRFTGGFKAAKAAAKSLTRLERRKMYDAVINYRCQVMCIDDADNPYVGHANTQRGYHSSDISDTRTAPLSHGPPKWSVGVFARHV